MEMSDASTTNVPTNIDAQIAQFLSQSYWYNIQMKIQSSCQAASAAIAAFEKAHPGVAPPADLSERTAELLEGSITRMMRFVWLLAHTMTRRRTPRLCATL